MLFSPPFSEDKLSEIDQQAESDGVGERMIILESIKVTEINAKDVVSEPCTQSNEFPVTIFRVLIVVSGSERKRLSYQYSRPNPSISCWASVTSTVSVPLNRSKDPQDLKRASRAPMVS